MATKKLTIKQKKFVYTPELQAEIVKPSKFNLLEGCATDSVHLDNSPTAHQHNWGNTHD